MPVLVEDRDLWTKMFNEAQGFEDSEPEPVNINEDIPNKSSKDNIERSWEELVSMAQEARENESTSKWVLGDTALMAMDLAGDNKAKRKEYLDRFSSETKVSLQSLKQYAWVSNTYPVADRNISPLLDWSHYRAALKAENKIKWLKKAADNDWSVAQLTRELETEKENDKIIAGHTCDRPECGHVASLDKNSRCSAQIHGHSFTFCSMACMYNFIISHLASVKDIVLGREPFDYTGKSTILMQDPVEDSGRTPEEWREYRLETEKAYMDQKYPKNPKATVIRREPLPMTLAPEPDKEVKQLTLV